MKNTDKIGFTMPYMDESDGISRKSKKQRKAERKLKRDMRKAGKKGHESEFMWDPHNEVMRIIPTDDGDSHNYPHLDKMYDILHPPPKKEAPTNRNHGTHEVGGKLSDKDVYNYEAKYHGLASSGRGLTAADVSDIQEDEHGQYVTWEKEITRGKDRGEKVIDTIRPVKKIGIFSDKIPTGYHTFKKN
mgnify:CR=1 FL=1|jgi:hypothetical protein